MRKVKEIKKVRIDYCLKLEDGSDFKFSLVCDGEWVLQGEDIARYSLDELEHILKELKDLNKKK